MLSVCPTSLVCMFQCLPVRFGCVCASLGASPSQYDAMPAPILAIHQSFRFISLQLPYVATKIHGQCVYFKSWSPAKKYDFVFWLRVMGKFRFSVSTSGRISCLGGQVRALDVSSFHYRHPYRVVLNETKYLCCIELVVGADCLVSIMCVSSMLPFLLYLPEYLCESSSPIF